MKKIISILLIAILALSLTGCGDSGTYKKAQAAFDEGKYEETIKLLDSIPNYEDSENLRESANTEILKEIVAATPGPDCCKVASDGSYIKVDTNPYDIDDYYNASYIQTVKDINKALGFTDLLWEKMGQTRALDGRMSDENDSYFVSWTYHPNNGLSVLYERK